ncbi:hypothetical protein JCM3774_003865 [Rhodotorula dairenensis]
MVDTLHVPAALLDEQPAHLAATSRRVEPSASAAIKQARRHSLRPPAPSKPPSMIRSLSDDHQRTAGAGAGQRSSSLAPAAPAPAVSINSPSLGARTAGARSPTLPPGTVSEEATYQATQQRWPQQHQQSRASPVQDSPPRGTSPPAAPSLPPRPVAKSSPVYASAPVDTTSPSSCPPVLSPFATAADNENDPVAPLMRPSASRSPERSRFRAFGGAGTGGHTNGNSSSGGLSSSASYSNLNPSGALSALNRGWQQAKLKDRLGAGVGYAKEWGGKGKGRLQDQWRGLGAGAGSASASSSHGGGSAGHRATGSVSTQRDSAGPSGGSSSSNSTTNSFAFSASSRTLSSFLSSSTTMPDLASSASTHQIGSRATGPSPARGGVRLPAVLYSVPVPDRSGVVFGQPLVVVVETTRAPSLPRPSSKDEVTGDDARYWLPGIAFRCLEYLEEWGMREEGVFRVPGRSSHTAELKAMFDAGVGQGRDLREVHPSELDPHAVASVFKTWLRELPDSLLSHEIESLVDELTIQSLGHGASSNNFLASTGAAASTGTPTNSAGGTPASSAPASPNLAQGYVEQLRDLMAAGMPAEHWHLLRAVIYHLARLADHAHVNKMTLNNLRLILSPTLRLSPGFLQLLVVERQALFSRPNEDAMRRSGHADPSTPLPPLPARRRAESATKSAARQLEPPRIDAGLANEAARARSPVLPPELAPPSPSAIPSSSPSATPRTNRFVSHGQPASPVSPTAGDPTPMLAPRIGGHGFEVEPRISSEPPQLERLSLGEEFRDAIEQFDRSVGGKVPTADFSFQPDAADQEQERLEDRTPSRPKTHRKGHSNMSISSMRSFMSSTSLSSSASSNANTSENDLRNGARVRHTHTASSSSSFWRRKPSASAAPSVSAAEKAKRRQSVAITLTGLGVDLPGDNSSSAAASGESIAQAGLLSVEERRRLFGG